MASSSSVTLDAEPIVRIDRPLPLPPYEFDDSLSEDENFLTWVSILARHSSSRKGHMGTIFVRPPSNGDPRTVANSESDRCSPPVKDRIIHYANNTPLLYSRLAKAVPEVHAEALVISRCARRGIALEGCTVYISFPPCNDCLMLLISVGVRRCVFKKSIRNRDAQGEAALVAAHVHQVELCGTLDAMLACQAVGDEEGATRERQLERKLDEERDQRVRKFWASQGEDAERTRARVGRWWEDYNARHRPAEKVIKQKYGESGTEMIEKRKQEVKEARKAAKREAQDEREAKKKMAKRAASTDRDNVSHNGHADDEASHHIAVAHVLSKRSDGMIDACEDFDEDEERNAGKDEKRF